MSFATQHGSPLLVFLFLCLVLFGRAVRVEAQFSPGPLARVHEDLEGALNCLKCHGIGRDQNISNQCMACHEGIGRLVAEGRGLHGHLESQECAECHPDHAGRNFSLIDDKTLKPGSFDHATSGWLLKGKHADVTCGVCHKKELRVSPILGLLKGGHRPWIGLETDCASCHDDAHGTRLGADCAACHTETSFLDVTATGFDHSKTAYPLRGAHAKVECQSCHGAAEHRVARPAFQSCSDCHADAHAGQAIIAGQLSDCGTCHTVNRFRPSTYTAIRHARNPFPLEGKHQVVPCAKCHAGDRVGVLASNFGSAGFPMHPAHTLCADCHTDAHAGQLAGASSAGECAACHATAGWKPSTFTVQDHASIVFALEGKHASTPCEACHGPNREFLPELPDREVLGEAAILFHPGESSCVKCHMNPHGSKYLDDDLAVGDRTCLACHDLQSFSPALVDADMHGRFEFALTGAHSAVPCFQCHADLTREPITSTLALAPAFSRPLTFKVAHEGCADCHQDQHRGQFDAACDECHVQTAFMPATGFEHDRDSSFPIVGAHSSVPCAACHRALSDAGGSFLHYKPIDSSCESCHSEGVPVGKAKS